MHTFAFLLLAHLIADFPLQTNRIFRLKLAGNRGILLHVLIHLVVTALLMRQPWQHWLLLGMLGVAHFATDWLKLRLQDPKGPQLVGFVFDQLAHVAVLGLLAAWRPEATAVLPTYLLLPAIYLAAIPAVMTMLWVWASDVCRIRGQFTCNSVTWACRRLLGLSQQMGWAVTLLVAAAGVMIAAV